MQPCAVSLQADEDSVVLLSVAVPGRAPVVG